jgi:serine/threonine protein kinase
VPLDDPAARLPRRRSPGLDAAHELTDVDGQRRCSSIHRDVSPQNMLVGVDGISRITDFGVASATSRLSARRGAGR